MNSIRPLVTITILTVVGVLLYFKIQNGPQLSEDLAENWNAPSASDSPAVTDAPGWTPPPIAVVTDPAAELGAADAAPPARPEVVAPVVVEASPSDTQPTPLPAMPELPPLTTNAPVTPVADAPVVTPAPPADRYSDSAPDTVPVAPVVSSPAVAPVASVAATTDELAPPPGSPYAAARPAIQAALTTGELPRAHLMLTQWYGDRSLPEAEQREIESLLSQLAGTVVYSTEHRLEPPYTVQAGETLQTIAQHYQVPWQLLAKINGVASATAIQPGQQLKVLRGPFMGIANLSTSELTLLLNGRYAGKFTITATGDSQLAEGDWVVQDKQLTPGDSGVTPASTAFTPAAPAIDRVLVLGSTTPGAAGNTLTLGSNAANIRVASRDAEELCDILSIGSRIVVRR